MAGPLLQLPPPQQHAFPSAPDSWEAKVLNAVKGVTGGLGVDQATWDKGGKWGALAGALLPAVLGIKIPSTPAKTVYHGTPKNFTAFNPAAENNPTHPLSDMWHFASDKKLGELFARLGPHRFRGSPDTMTQQVLSVKLPAGEYFDAYNPSFKEMASDIDRLADAALTKGAGQRLKDTMMLGNKRMATPTNIEFDNEPLRTLLELDPEILTRAGFKGVRYNNRPFLRHDEDYDRINMTSWALPKTLSNELEIVKREPLKAAILKR